LKAHAEIDFQFYEREEISYEDAYLFMCHFLFPGNLSENNQMDEYEELRYLKLKEVLWDGVDYFTSKIVSESDLEEKMYLDFPPRAKHTKQEWKENQVLEEKLFCRIIGIAPSLRKKADGQIIDIQASILYAINLETDNLDFIEASKRAETQSREEGEQEDKNVAIKLWSWAKEAEYEWFTDILVKRQWLEIKNNLLVMKYGKQGYVLYSLKCFRENGHTDEEALALFRKHNNKPITKDDAPKFASPIKPDVQVRIEKDVRSVINKFKAN